MRIGRYTFFLSVAMHKKRLKIQAFHLTSLTFNKCSSIQDLMRCMIQPLDVLSCGRVINVARGSYRVAPLTSAIFCKSERTVSGRVSSLAALSRRIINDDKKEKQGIRERVNDLDPQGAAAIKILRSRLTPCRNGEQQRCRRQ